MCYLTIISSRLIAEGKPLSVCELLGDLGRYRERVVRVRAVVAGGGRHGSYLRDIGPEAVCLGLQKWPPAIDLVSTRQESQIEGPLGFTPDEEGIRAIWRSIQEVAPSAEHRKVEAIFIGKIESRKGIEIHKFDENGEPGWMGNGYGHLGQFPAQLVLQSMDDISAIYQGNQYKIPSETKN
jgi:hypothetical protein